MQGKHLVVITSITRLTTPRRLGRRSLAPLLLLASAVLAAGGASALAQPVLPDADPVMAKFPQQPGPPDLVLRATVAPASLPAVSNASPAETSVINVTVENQVTPYGYPLFGKYFRVRGSEARAVFVSITLPPSLAQVGNITATGGFECGISLSGNTVVCWNGTIAAGARVGIQIEVRSVANHCWPDDRPGEIRASVDPYNWITEASEANNEASSVILLVGVIC